MKKLAFVFAAIVAVSFASCGNRTEQGADVDTDTVAPGDTLPQDSADSASVAPDTVAATAAPEAK